MSTSAEHREFAEYARRWLADTLRLISSRSAASVVNCSFTAAAPLSAGFLILSARSSADFTVAAFSALIPLVRASWSR